MNDKLKVIGKILLVVVYAIGFLVLLAQSAYHILYNTETFLKAIALIVWSIGISVANFIAGMIVIVSVRRK